MKRTRGFVCGVTRTDEQHILYGPHRDNPQTYQALECNGLRAYREEFQALKTCHDAFLNPNPFGHIKCSRLGYLDLCLAETEEDLASFKHQCYLVAVMFPVPLGADPGQYELFGPPRVNGGGFEGRQSCRENGWQTFESFVVANHIRTELIRQTCCPTTLAILKLHFR